ncbi:MAG: sugar ABC transporter permease [Hydrogenibacillus sp.]|nr:sugar ABC transporter permease [Hydrogenibacillus sp.]
MMAGRRRRRRVFRDRLTEVLFAFPALWAFATVILVPFGYGIYLTFTDWDGVGARGSFVGWQNFVRAFYDGRFWHSMTLTLAYVAVSTVLLNVIAFGLAYALTRGVPGERVLRAGFFAPNLLGGIVLGFVWQFIFLRVLVHLGESFDVAWLMKSWLSSPTSAFWALVVVTVWQYAGYMMVIYIGGLMNIPGELFEAAAVDGAGPWTRLVRIVLPLVTPATVISIFLSLQRSFMVYDVNLALTGGGPYRSTELISMYVYRKAFVEQQYASGQAQAFILFAVASIIALVQVYVGKRREIEA